MGSPSGLVFLHQVVRLGLAAIFSCALFLPVHSREPAHPSLFEVFLHVDAGFLDAGQIAAARSAFEALVREASPCGAAATSSQSRARCVVDKLFGSGKLESIAEPGDLESSTLTSALVSHRGNCAGLSALALAVAEGVDVPMEAIVFPRHVVVRAPGDKDHVFELLSRGSRLPIAQLRKQLGPGGAHDTGVRANAFPAYYLDNLAVRLGDAGDGDRAQGMFEKAIDAAPRVSRIRFNYGTFLLGRDRVKLAERELRRAVRLDSRNSPAWANLGVALARLGEIADARDCFEHSLRYDPANSIAAQNLRTLGGDGSPPP
jgi:tetratricopeptide (TPR) repeat protein